MNYIGYKDSFKEVQDITNFIDENNIKYENSYKKAQNIINLIDNS